ncbi:nephronectin-like isoform X4 [Acipenser oxyrinchus oxyrinchus]|uniref:Nephronectin-like isoform X4 n=1 Tax=Acipenser oxyrinchus oxyrinchus TaxID=40147 RepID=A0AAD8GIW9_ACIOX|nr:nephronectin-like isoform X4 [Acipenser oxyrinchus oxyrinchus]
MELLIKLVLVSTLYLGAAGDFDGRWPRRVSSSNGLCRYGARVDCCWGWTRRSWGQCQPLCQPECKHGECVGPNKCKCYLGYTGKTCNQDLNECGLKPRPCKHRCMNTYGSYKCYCLNGYMLMPDGTCGNARSCSMANCQYGCDVVKGETRCHCPLPGLQLGSDGRTCVDVDECATGRAVCPRFRKCINTFGSYICKCHEGFDLKYINGKYQCIDVNECLSSVHQCSSFAMCYNTPGSYKCKCKGGFKGNGFECKPIPKVIIDPPLPGKKENMGNLNTTKGNGCQNKIPDSDCDRKITTTRLPVTTRKTVTTTTIKTTTTKSIRTTAPPKRTTPAPIVTRKPMVVTTTKMPIVTTAPERDTTVDNSIRIEVSSKPRGDVHIPRNPGENNIIIGSIELGETADEEEARDDSDVILHSCSFDHGLCGWLRDRESDLHWETTSDAAGGKYLTIPEVFGKRGGRAALLALPLGQSVDSGELCLSFRHKLSGQHSGSMQVYVKRNGAHGPAVWGRTGGHGWRHTQITLWGAGLQSVILKGERLSERLGEIGLDDVSLRRGSCSGEHTLRRH